MTAPAETAEPTTGLSTTGKLLVMLVIGAAVAVALGVYAKQHTPTHEKPYTLFFSGTIQLKAWFATLALALACVQMLLAARLYGKISIPRQAPSWLGDVDRLTGTAAFAVTLPVAYQCLWGLGFQTATTGVLLHGIFGCAVPRRVHHQGARGPAQGLPNWVLPVAGGLVFAALVGIFLTSSLWFFTSSAVLPAIF